MNMWIETWSRRGRAPEMTSATGREAAADGTLRRKAPTDDVYVSITQHHEVFRRTRALDCALSRIRRGEFFSLLGPSGCGKTTLLRIIGGFETPTSGDLLIAGRSALGDLPYRRRTNMVFQHGALFPHLTVAQKHRVRAGDEAHAEARYRP